MGGCGCESVKRNWALKRVGDCHLIWLQRKNLEETLPSMIIFIVTLLKLLGFSVMNIPKKVLK